MTDELRNRPNTAGLGEPVWDSRNSDEPATPTPDAAGRAVERIRSAIINEIGHDVFADGMVKPATATAIIREEHAIREAAHAMAATIAKAERDQDVAELVEALQLLIEMQNRDERTDPDFTFTDGGRRDAWTKARAVLARHTAQTTEATKGTL